jgi:hypothetical protein
MAKRSKCELDRLTRAMRLALFVAWGDPSSDNWRAYWNHHVLASLVGGMSQDSLRALIQRAHEDHCDEA